MLFTQKYFVLYLSLYKPVSKNILWKSSFLFLLTADLVRLITLGIVNIFAKGKESYESILIHTKL